jgi:membrane protease YdiL (CAAX protease family)
MSFMAVAWQVFVLAIVVLPAVLVCERMWRRIREGGGRVTTGLFDRSDLALSFLLCGLFGLMVFSVGAGPATGMDETANEPGINIKLVIPNAVIFVGLLGGLLIFLQMRGISPVVLFGLSRWPLGRAALVGGLLLAAIFPAMLGLGAAMQHLLQESAVEQDMVKLYRDTVQAGDLGGVLTLGLVAVVLQPVVEEVIFRGYLYAVFKGWSGALASAVFTSIFFAAVHGSVAALPALTVLALMLVLAYEWSGTLVVPIAMHAVFNGAQLAMLTWMTAANP